MNYFFAQKNENERKQAYEYDFKMNAYKCFCLVTNIQFFWFHYTNTNVGNRNKLDNIE
jgi:hypothetical protein